MVNENINGEIQIGKLTLTLWGQVKVRVDGIVLNGRSAGGQDAPTVLSVKNAYFVFRINAIQRIDITT